MSKDLTTLSAAAKRNGHIDVRTLALALQGKEEPEAQLVTPKQERIALYNRDRLEILSAELVASAKRNAKRSK
jgi:hypothetical protein